VSIRREKEQGPATPERGDCYLDEAKVKNAGLVLGLYVRLVKDVWETDRYGRLLRYVYVGQTFVKYEMVWQGGRNGGSQDDHPAEYAADRTRGLGAADLGQESGCGEIGSF
jgi:endonuclease YncB( thermonuclease family)